MEIQSRNFSVKIERNNKDGTKTLIDVSKLSAVEQANHEVIVHSVFDKLVEKDDLREAKAVLDYVMNLK
jgi:hypothetical protein